VPKCARSAFWGHSTGWAGRKCAAGAVCGGSFPRVPGSLYPGPMARVARPAHAWSWRWLRGRGGSAPDQGVAAWKVVGGRGARSTGEDARIVRSRHDGGATEASSPLSRARERGWCATVRRAAYPGMPTSLSSEQRAADPGQGKAQRRGGARPARRFRLAR
jgi:hypothetical protein